MGEVMPLTPEDVSNKRFTPVRLREGYDMGEVDQFLDEVEAELARLTKENDDLRSKLSAAQTGSAPSRPAPEPEPAKVEEKPGADRPRPPGGAGRRGLRRPVETIRVETVPEASNAAARLLEIATRNADELVEEAKNEADKIVRGPPPRPSGSRPSRRARPTARGRRPPAVADARLRDRRAPPADVRRPGEGARQAQQRGGEPPLVRARVPLAPQELLHPAARGPADHG